MECASATWSRCGALRRSSAILREVRSPDDPNVELVKRIIGLPEDTVRALDGRRIKMCAGGTETRLIRQTRWPLLGRGRRAVPFDRLERVRPCASLPHLAAADRQVPLNLINSRIDAIVWPPRSVADAESISDTL